MPSEFPPQQFPPRLSRNAKIGLGAFLLVTLAYSFVIAGQILLWFVLVGIAAGIYVAWALVVAVFRMVEAVERLADAMEARNRRAIGAAGGETDVGDEGADVADAEGEYADGARANTDDGS